MRSRVVLISIVLAGSPAWAGTEVRRSGLDHFLISDVRVQRELKLSEARRVAAWDSRWRTSEQLGDLIRDHLRRKDAVDRRKDAEAEARIHAEHAASPARMLSREQLAHYEQIRLQYLREEALLEPAVQRAIKLDAGRAEKLASIFFGYLEGHDRRVEEAQKLPMKEQLPLVSKRMLDDMAHRDAALKQIRELLTDEQRAAFVDLQGPAFRVEGREPLGSMRYQAFRRS